MTIQKQQALRWGAGIILGALVLLFTATAPLSAAQTNLSLQILPIECQFEIINDGQNTIRYITPEECGQVVDQPPTEPDGTGQVDESDDQGEPSFRFGVPTDEAPQSLETPNEINDISNSSLGQASFASRGFDYINDISAGYLFPILIVIIALAAAGFISLMRLKTFRTAKKSLKNVLLGRKKRQ